MRALVRLTTLVTLTLTNEIAHGASVSGLFVEKGANAPLAAVEVVLRNSADSSVVAHTVSGADGRCRISARRWNMTSRGIGNSAWLLQAELSAARATSTSANAYGALDGVRAEITRKRLGAHHTQVMVFVE